ncbi:MAG TPA: hypothetical protein VMG12_03505 [Polyangiaceae bacterium]|nr:hypothetical protein [Polyangiaceae bacterium]
MEQQNVGSKRSASGASGKIAAKSHEAAQQMKDAVVGQVDQVRDRASSAKAQTSERIQGVATQLQGMSDSLRENDPLAADLAERASRGVENVARYVSSSDARRLLRDTEQLARRQPALFFGGAFLLGLAAGRFLKSSSPYPDLEHDGPGERDRGGPLARPGERESGFFPSGERNVRSNRRYQENYAATFGRDTGSSSPLAGSASERGPEQRNTSDWSPSATSERATSERATSERSPSDRTANERGANEREASRRNDVAAGNEPGKAAGRGERP